MTLRTATMELRYPSGFKVAHSVVQAVTIHKLGITKEGRSSLPLNKNGIKRNLSILGGEPMCEQNIDIVHSLLTYVKAKLPDVKIYLWTGYELNDLIHRKTNKTFTKEILEMVDVLIDGLFEKDLCNTSLRLRGSSNQKIYKKKNGVFYDCSMERVHG